MTKYFFDFRPKSHSGELTFEGPPGQIVACNNGLRAYCVKYFNNVTTLPVVD
jgi:hypothetical protein